MNRVVGVAVALACGWLLGHFVIVPTLEDLGSGFTAGYLFGTGMTMAISALAYGDRTRT